jgi:hypothetical protein
MGSSSALFLCSLVENILLKFLCSQGFSAFVHFFFSRNHEGIRVVEIFSFLFFFDLMSQIIPEPFTYRVLTLPSSNSIHFFIGSSKSYFSLLNDLKIKFVCVTTTFKGLTFNLTVKLMALVLTALIRKFLTHQYRQIYYN